MQGPAVEKVTSRANSSTNFRRTHHAPTNPLQPDANTQLQIWLTVAELAAVVSHPEAEIVAVIAAEAIAVVDVAVAVDVAAARARRRSGSP